MNVTEIPFVKHVGIGEKEKGTLQLEVTDVTQNHMQGIHAAAQFALAETQSGLYLQSLFPEYIGKVVPLLRSSIVKYKRPAMKTIYATSCIENEEKEKFITLFEKKGRASIVLKTEILDEEEILIMQGEFNWFIQKL